MKFADFISDIAIQPKLAAVDKEGAIRELIGGLCNAGEIDTDQQENVVACILEREQLGTTGIGRGIAVPHTKHNSVMRTVGTVGVSTDGVAFDSLDGNPVKVLFLLVSPPDQSERHLKVLEKISRHLREDMFCRFLIQSKTIEDVQQVLTDVDED